MSIEPYLQLAELLRDSTLLLSGSGIILFANRAVASRLGIDPTGLHGKALSAAVIDPPEAVDPYLRACARSRDLVLGAVGLLGADGRAVACRAEGAVLRPRRDGDEGLILLRLIPKESTVSQFLALNQKIAELGQEILRRRQAEEQLRQQREWLHVTLSSIGDAVIATDTGGAIRFMNPAAEALTGWTQPEALGRPLEQVFPIVDEVTREPVENHAARALREGCIVGPDRQAVLIARGGAERAIDETAAPIREDQGATRGAVLVFHDISDRRRLERELQQRAESLAEADRRKDEFLAMLAHELRNPLASINNAIHFFGRSETEEDLEWAKEVVERQVKHLARLIDDLLDVSRITRGKIALRREPVNLAPILNSALEAVRPLIEERKHELTVSLAPGALRLDADPLRLEQIVVNLLSNAAKYTDAGGRIALTAGREGREVVIRVRDTGVGITPELLPHVFELFTQGDRSIARSEGGLGIGLTLVRKLAEMHGGSVSASSEGPGRGSEFTVRLPALEAPAAEGPKPRAPALPRLARKASRVLVVDDNVDTARGLAKLLRLLGHDIQMAHDGPGALEAARAHRPEVVLLDLGLPGMDGYQVAEHLRQEGHCPDALLVAISGYGKEEDRRRSRAAGFDHHLVKPVDFDTLLAVIAPPRPAGLSGG